MVRAHSIVFGVITTCCIGAIGMGESPPRTTTGRRPRSASRSPGT